MDAPSTGRARPASGSPANDCLVLDRPRELSFTGPMALWFGGDAAPGDAPRAIFNVDGRPRVAQIAPRAAGSKSKSMLAFDAEGASPQGCAVAFGFAFCPAPNGEIRRTPVLGGEGMLVARSRPGTAISAARVGGHTALAYLDDVQTPEGILMQAFATLDGAKPVRISEEGTGATAVMIASYADRALALYVDERRAMSPVHVRVLSVTAAGALVVGTDAVVFVADGAGGRVASAIAATPEGPSLALVSSARDMKSFGMAAVTLLDPPKDDAPATWSMYPGGFDGAAFAATLDVSPVRALGVRPTTSDPASPHALELGRFDEGGALHTSCTVAESPGFRDLAIAADPEGALWLGYTSRSRTWLERRGKVTRR